MAESGSCKKITVHTDGACDGNPGTGGWAALLRYGNHVRELTGGEPASVNPKPDPASPEATPAARARNPRQTQEGLGR
jgi:hypothetical protein